MPVTTQSLFACPDFAAAKGAGERQATLRPWADWTTLPPGPAICSSAVFGSCEDETARARDSTFHHLPSPHHLTPHPSPLLPHLPRAHDARG